MTTIRPLGRQILRFQSGGGGGIPPGYIDSNDPEALYAACTIGGFVPDPAIYIPPVILPESTPQSIIYVCNGAFAWENDITHDLGNGTTGGVDHLWEVFDKNGNLIYSLGNISTFNYTFPSTENYTIKFSALNTRTILKCTSQGSTAVPKMTVTAAIFNTPNLNSLQYSFLHHRNFLDVKFNTSISGITSMSQAFAYTKLRKFDFEDSYPYLTTCNQAFLYTEECEYVKFPRNCYVPLLQNITNIIGYSAAREIVFPEQMPALTDIHLACQYTKRLKKITFWDYAPLIEVANAFLSNSGIEGDLIVPEMPLTISRYYFLSNCYLLKSVKFLGDVTVALNDGNLKWFENNYVLEEVELPRSNLGLSQIFGSNLNKLKRVRTYDVCPSGIAFPVIANLEEVTGDGDNSGLVGQQNINIGTGTSYKMRIFNVPKARVNRLVAGGASTNKMLYLETLVIDWANSSFDNVSVPQILINAYFDTAWITALYNALPVVSAGQVCDVGQCPGYTDANEGIATAKGWTVRGLAKIANGYVDNIGQSTATFNGEIYYLGGYAGTSGVCYNTTGNPTTSNTKTSAGNSVGTFSQSISGLTKNRTYYCRAYCTTTYGTVYGQQFTFTTLP